MKRFRRMLAVTGFVLLALQGASAQYGLVLAPTYIHEREMELWGADFSLVILDDPSEYWWTLGVDFHSLPKIQDSDEPRTITQLCVCFQYHYNFFESDNAVRPFAEAGGGLFLRTTPRASDGTSQSGSDESSFNYAGGLILQAGVGLEFFQHLRLKASPNILIGYGRGIGLQLSGFYIFSL